MNRLMRPSNLNVLFLIISERPQTETPSRILQAAFITLSLFHKGLPSHLEISQDLNLCKIKKKNCATGKPATKNIDR